MSNYITTAFEKTVRARFPERAEALNAAMRRRLEQLRAENADADEGKMRHLEGQIMPGIAAYETLQTVMPKDEALQTVHGYVEARAWKLRRMIRVIVRLPGLYRRLPGLFAKGTAKMFGEAAGFEAKTYPMGDNVWRVDMLKCPYHDACVQYGCPELCPSFCDSDDITYDGMHPKVIWHRTKTLGRGNDCCDFCLTVEEKKT